MLCETYTPEGKPLPSNTRNAAAKVFSTKENTDAIPWFGLEQVSFLTSLCLVRVSKCVSVCMYVGVYVYVTICMSLYVHVRVYMYVINRHEYVTTLLIFSVLILLNFIIFPTPIIFLFHSLFFSIDKQEYTLFNLDEVTPLGWPTGGYPKPQGKYLCAYVLV